MRKRFSRTLSLFLAVLMLHLTALPVAATSTTSATAATMQLMKTTGTVNVTNSNRRGLTKRDNMRLYSGYHIETKASSYAWINLDSSKLAKLDAVSEAEVRKSGKMLELLLNSGSLFFNVTSPLKDDETLNIRTATMVVGIRGTCGWVRMIDRWSTEICVLEGKVKCSVTDPVTGQIKTATLQSGDKAVAAVYSQDKEGAKCGITRGKVEASDISGFVLKELAQNHELCGDIYKACGLDPLPPIGFLESVRQQLDEIREEMGSIREQLEGGELSLEDAQSRLSDSRQQMEDLRGQLEQSDAGSDVQQRLDEAQGHLDQVQDALGSAQGQGDGVQQGVLDSLGSIQDALDNAHQEASNAQHHGSDSAHKRLEEDEKKKGDSLDRIGDQKTKQDTTGVWGGTETPGGGTDTSGGNTGGGNTGGGNTGDGNTGDGNTDGGGATGQPAPKELTMPQSAENVLAALKENREVILQLDPNGNNTLKIDIPMVNIEEGQTLTLSDGIDVEIDEGCILNISGAMIVSNTNEIRNNGSIMNEGGHITAKNIITSETGSFASGGTVNGTVTCNGGSVTISGGTITSTGTAGAALVVQGNAKIIIDGTIDGANGPAILIDASSSATITIGNSRYGTNNALIKSNTSPIIRHNGDDTAKLQYVVGVESTVDGSTLTEVQDSIEGFYYLALPDPAQNQ